MIDCFLYIDVSSFTSDSSISHLFTISSVDCCFPVLIQFFIFLFFVLPQSKKNSAISRSRGICVFLRIV